jgi:hypothetical protein
MTTGIKKLEGARDGRAVDLPQDLDAIVIQTEHGGIYIDLTAPVPGMVLLRASVADQAAGGRQRRLILSPMDGARLAVGVIVA